MKYQSPKQEMSAHIRCKVTTEAFGEVPAETRSEYRTFNIFYLICSNIGTFSNRDLLPHNCHACSLPTVPEVMATQSSISPKGQVVLLSAKVLWKAEWVSQGRVHTFSRTNSGSRAHTLSIVIPDGGGGSTVGGTVRA